MIRSVNNLVALIPEWEFEKLNILAHRVKVGNGVLINSKDLKFSQGSLFSLEVLKMGGVVLTMNDATQIVSGKMQPIIFEKNKENITVIENPIIEEKPNDEITGIENDNTEKPSEEGEDGSEEDVEEPSGEAIEDKEDITEEVKELKEEDKE